MQFYKTVNDRIQGKLRLEFVDSAYITACNGFSVWIAKDGNQWNITESTSGFTMGQSKTLKGARLLVDKIIQDIGVDKILEHINRNINYIQSQGIELPNL